MGSIYTIDQDGTMINGDVPTFEGKIVVWTAYNVYKTIYDYVRAYTYNLDGTIASETITGRDVNGNVLAVTRLFSYASGNLTSIGHWTVVP